MNTAKLREILSRRISLNVNDDIALMECWKKEADILSEDITETIAFLASCTDDEFFWLSEVFDDLIEKTQSRDLFQAICERIEKISNPEYKSSISTDIEFARDQFND